MAYLLGIDSSTTATKALVIKDTGEVVAVASHEYPYESPQPGWTEQDASLFWEGTVSSIRAVLAKTGLTGSDIVAVGLTGQMHGMVLLDKNGEPIRPVILWNDQRTAAECAEITQRVGEARVLELTGNPVLTGFTAPEIVWTRTHEPEAYARVAKVLLPKDYVRYKLSGDYFSEVSDASGTSLLNVAERRWSDEILKVIDLPREWLPEVTESPEVSSKVSTEAAAATGLKAGTPIVGGGGDQAAGAVGMGIVRQGLVSATLGTSGVVFAASDQYRVEPQGRLHAFCHAVPGMWHLMGVVLSAAGSFRWYRDSLGHPEKAIAGLTNRDAYDILTDEAATIPAGSEGLLFLPYLTGERTPYPDPNARGVFFGLSIRHGKPHMTRAVLEGVTYALRDSLELMRDLGLTMSQVRAAGGGARSPLWRQMLADVFTAEIATVNSTEGAAYGAALLAGVGARVFASVQVAGDTAVRVTDQLQPGPAAAVYADYYPQYRALYPALAPHFAQVAQVVNKHLA